MDTLTIKFRDFLNEQLKNPDFRAEYEALEAEDTITQAIITAQDSTGLTLEQLAEKTGISQSEIQELQTGNANPTLQKLKNLANALGMKLKLEFQPMA